MLSQSDAATFQSACIGEIERRLREAQQLASAAQTFSKAGSAEFAMRSLLDVEPLIYEANGLLQAAAMVARVTKDD